MVVVGQIARDLVLRIDVMPDAGQAADVRARREVLGGKGANQAVSVAQLGERVGLLSVIGDDDAGTRVLDQARQDGIDVTTVVRRADTPTGLIVEALEANGDWRYLQHLPDPVLLTEDDITAAGDALDSASAVLVQLQQPPAAAVAAARHGRAGGGLVVCDGAPADAQRDALLAVTDVVRADERETQLLLGFPADDVDVAVDAAQDLLDAGPSLIALASAAGNLFIWPGGHLLIPKADAPVVDTTGAGDALTAALAVALFHGDAPDRAARLAAAAATVTVGHAGGRPRLDDDTLGIALEQIDDVVRHNRS